MPKVTEAVQNFLRARRATHNGPDLLDRWTPFMETQVNVAADNGEPVEGKPKTYTDGEYEWFPIRIPKNAATSPEFRDYELRWPLDLHVEGIGWTGWDWSARKSRALGFDFDSITGHAKGIGISNEELERVKEHAKSLSYVEVRRSTGGNGLHLYVYFDEAGIPTANHTEHAALGRSVLGMMSRETGFDFASQIDACGGNMWIWHRKMNAANSGLTLLKPAEVTLAISDLPANWRDHIEVVNRRRAKIRVHTELKDEHLDPFEALTSARKKVPLDDTHKAIMDKLSRSGFSAVWVQDHYLFQTHTKALANLIDDAETCDRLGLIGLFKTISAGKNPGTPNCFMFPLEKGAWKVYRFSPETKEAETWTQDKGHWTTCYFNRRPDLESVARALGGQLDPDRGGFLFDAVPQAIRAAEILGQRGIQVRDTLLKYKAKLKAHKDGRLIMEIIGKSAGKKPLEGWISKKGKFVKVFDLLVETRKEEVGSNEYDHLIRQVVSPSNEDAGWLLRGTDGIWRRFPTEKVKMRLISLGHSKPEVEQILGSTIGKAWKLVNLPFQVEYPGDRQWNIDAAQWAFQPAKLEYDETPHHPHWDRVLRHCGQDLDAAVRLDPWCQMHSIKSGADYLLCWIAYLLRDPFQKLPYLFLYGDQNSGKSILHESISLLMTKGVAQANRALTKGNQHNGELANCVLAYVEEMDLSKEESYAYRLIKEWITGEFLWIRQMRTDAYKQRNTLHMIHTSNHLKDISLEMGDKRIVIIFVPALEPGEEIPKDALLERLKGEAPHFLRTITDYALPTPHSRLGLPPLWTRNKERAEEINSNPVENFIREQCFRVPGEYIYLVDFKEKFKEWLPEDLRPQWKDSRIEAEVKGRFPCGRYSQNKRIIGNLCWENKTPDPNAKPWTVEDGWMTRKE